MDIRVSDWWASAALWMSPMEFGASPEQIASGPLAEIVELARTANCVEQNLLFITSPALDGDIVAAQVHGLVSRPDFPVVI